MIHPLLTLMFDLFLIGSAGSILAAMVGEYFVNRGPAVGRIHTTSGVRRGPAIGRPAEARSQRPHQSFRVGARG